jgi:hypothetical protein
MRLSAISFAGTARTLVAVGTLSDASMFATMRAATPRIGLVLTPVGAAFAGGAVGSAFAGAGAAFDGAGAAAGAVVEVVAVGLAGATVGAVVVLDVAVLDAVVAVVEAAAAGGCVAVVAAAPPDGPATGRVPFVAAPAPVPFVVGAGPPANASAGL